MGASSPSDDESRGFKYFYYFLLFSVSIFWYKIFDEFFQIVGKTSRIYIRKIKFSKKILISGLKSDKFLSTTNDCLDCGIFKKLIKKKRDGLFLAFESLNQNISLN